MLALSAFPQLSKPSKGPLHSLKKKQKDTSSGHEPMTSWILRAVREVDTPREKLSPSALSRQQRTSWP